MIIVMGEPGAGKTTVLTAALKQLPGWRSVVYGDLMFDIARKMGIARKDDIRKQPVAIQKKIQEKVARALAKEKGKLILDTHCSILTPEGYIPGLPYSLLKSLRVERLIYISAPIEHIMARRQRDTSRARDLQPRAALEEHALLNRAFLCAYSALTGAPATIILNEDGALEKAVERFVALVKSGED
ncbi:MAG: adenylate kinase [Candidatus Micrarchaeia archaeon]